MNKYRLIKVYYNNEDNKYYQNMVKSLNDNFDQLKDRFTLVKFIKKPDVFFELEIYNYDGKKFYHQNYFLNLSKIIGIIDGLPIN